MAAGRNAQHDGAAITLSTPDAFHLTEAREQLLQGLLAGAFFCLLAYSLMQWLSLRDPSFLHYALVLGGTATFFIACFGLGPQHLWGDNAWMNEHVAPTAVLIALAGALPFIERTLGIGSSRPLLARAMRASAIFAALTAAGFAADLIAYPMAQLIATLMGPLPMVMAVPVAYRQARAGDRIAAWLLAGWGMYGVGVLAMAALLRGFVEANFWTQHSFQFGATFEMVIWMRVLGVRIGEMRSACRSNATRCVRWRTPTP